MNVKRYIRILLDLEEIEDEFKEAAMSFDNYIIMNEKLIGPLKMEHEDYLVNKLKFNRASAIDDMLQQGGVRIAHFLNDDEINIDFMANIVSNKNKRLLLSFMNKMKDGIFAVDVTNSETFGELFSGTRLIYKKALSAVRKFI